MNCQLHNHTSLISICSPLLMTVMMDNTKIIQWIMTAKKLDKKVFNFFIVILSSPVLTYEILHSPPRWETANCPCFKYNSIKTQSITRHCQRVKSHTNTFWVLIGKLILNKSIRVASCPNGMASSVNNNNTKNEPTRNTYGTVGAHVMSSHISAGISLLWD